MNYETFQREKVNDRFEFPSLLDLYPYSTEGMAWRARVDAAASAEPAAPAGGADADLDAGAGSPAPTSSEPRPYLLHPKEYYEYELVGVVVHMGTADSGHYYSLIRERGGSPGTAAGSAVCAAGVMRGGLPTAVDPGHALESTAAHGMQQAEAKRASHAGEWFEFNDSIVQVRCS